MLKVVKLLFFFKVNISDVKQKIQDLPLRNRTNSLQFDFLQCLFSHSYARFAYACPEAVCACWLPVQAGSFCTFLVHQQGQIVLRSRVTKNQNFWWG